MRLPMARMFVMMALMLFVKQPRSSLCCYCQSELCLRNGVHCGQVLKNEGMDFGRYNLSGSSHDTAVYLLFSFLIA